jgi:hypothetical protein
MLHKGLLPADLVESENANRTSGAKMKTAPLKELTAKRDRAIQLCEMLHLQYSGMLGCLSLGDTWSTPFPDDASRIREMASGRTQAGLIRDIKRIDDARGDIDRNLNIGLMMSVLFQELIDNAKQEAVAART